MRTTLAITRAFCRAKRASDSSIPPSIRRDRTSFFSSFVMAFGAAFRQYLSIPFLSWIIARYRTSGGSDLSRYTAYNTTIGSAFVPSAVGGDVIMPAVMDNNPAAFPKLEVGRHPSGCVPAEMNPRTEGRKRLAADSKERLPQELQ
jgi:hypothetical protein